MAMYHEFRPTKDVDAWWTSDANEEERDKLIQVLKDTLEQFGSVEERRFGDVVCLDLHKGGQVVFNFQIARRSAQLRPTISSPWKPVALDSFEDLVASKMTALVERGIPRDFLDIYEICINHLCSVNQCWQLWKAREEKRGAKSIDSKVAKNAVLMHLKRIERMRPLDLVKDNKAREHAETVREWFKNEFCFQKD
ncbi:hypothetical protein GWN42_06530 [candidate division KSB1 bacterium]|nr:hypothetical protein [candidate division KSB1 bacterium]